ncbi:MAG TPA: aryl-sulfate sulfotransferase [Bryobacteraceae bacterium]|nr:aryl-sulfate sulfotransferase [Bryobacteraceae bacterium]
MLVFRRSMHLKRVLILLLLFTAITRADMSALLTPSLSDPAPVGSTVTWYTSVSDPSPGTLWYRFRVREAGSEFHVVRDFGPQSSFDWTPADHEGAYEVEVTVRNIDTAEAAVTTATYNVAPLAVDAPLVSATTNSFVYLYSAPPCPPGSTMQVEFWTGRGRRRLTTPKTCDGRSMNFYVGGIAPGATYSVRHVIQDRSGQTYGPEMKVTPDPIRLPIAAYQILKPAPQPAVDGVLLQSPTSQIQLATDLAGNPLWYYAGPLTYITRPEPGGKFLGVYQDARADPSGQLLREFDLSGATLRETNAARVSEQLAARGMRPITGFHHEARPLPNGQILALASTEQILTDVQGPGLVDVIGDMILVLDANLQVVWAWDAFDHLDPRRPAVLGETCVRGGGGCPPFYQAQQANDWLHGNSLQLTPDGNILYSARHQDWVLKIDYNNGAGSGDVIWRLGKGGDFTIDSSDLNPWFSHQHDAGFVGNDNTLLAVFDNGNTRYADDQSSHSRGQVLRIDEQSRTASLVLNVDLGTYSDALGSAQQLDNGNWHFDIGWTRFDPTQPPNASQSVEVDPSGNIVYQIRILTPMYRTHRMRDLYTP